MKVSWVATLLLLLSVVAMAADANTSGYTSPQAIMPLTPILTFIPTFTIIFPTTSTHLPTFTFIPSLTFTFTTSTPTLPPAIVLKTDWAVLGVQVTPSNPQAGDPLLLSMDFAPLSSTVSLPQSVYIQCQIDGISCGAGKVTHTGPMGIPMRVSADNLWPATPGHHILTWFISTANDPNPANNAMSLKFFVQPPQGPITPTVQPTQSLPSATLPQTVVQPTTVVQTSIMTVGPSTASTLSSGTSDTMSSLLQGNTLPIIVIGGLILLAIALLKRKSHSPTSAPTKQSNP